MCVLIDTIDVLYEAHNQKMSLGKSSSNLGFIPRIPIRTELKISNCVCVRISDKSQQLTVRVISCPVDYPPSGRGPVSQQYLPTISHLKNPPDRDIMVNRSDMILLAWQALILSQISPKTNILGFTHLDNL
jgi:hypothetical protein